MKRCFCGKQFSNLKKHYRKSPECLRLTKTAVVDTTLSEEVKQEIDFIDAVDKAALDVDLLHEVFPEWWMERQIPHPTAGLYFIHLHSQQFYQYHAGVICRIEGTPAFCVSPLTCTNSCTTSRCLKCAVQIEQPFLCVSCIVPQCH